MTNNQTVHSNTADQGISDEAEKGYRDILNLVEKAKSYLKNEIVDGEIRSEECITKIEKIRNQEYPIKIADAKQLLKFLQRHPIYTPQYKTVFKGIWMDLTYSEICENDSLGLNPDTIKYFFPGKKNNTAGICQLMHITIILIHRQGSYLDDFCEMEAGEDSNSKSIETRKSISALANANTFKESITIYMDEINKQNLGINNSVVREKWNQAFKERCENINVLGMSKSERYQRIGGNISEFWQEICLKDETSENDCKSISEFIQSVNSDHQSKKIIVYGDQGLGKTSLLKLLAIKCSEGIFLNNCIPFFLSMPRIYGKFEKEFHETESADLHGCIANWIIGKSDITLTELEALVSEGKVLFLLDRIDFNHKVFQAVKEFIIKFENNNFVLTSNFQINDLNDFKTFEIRGFEGIDESKVSFVENWFQNHIANNGDEKNKEYLKQIVTSDSIYSNFANSPLLLQFLCLASLKNNLAYKIKSDKLLLYQDALFSLIREKDRDSGFDPDDKFYEKLKPFERVDLISYIAFEVFDRHRVFIGIEELGKFAQDYYFYYQHNQIDLFQAKAVIRSIEIQDGLLVNRLEKYAFSHITIQEFFVSWYISQNLDKWEDWTNSHIDDRRWQKIFDQAEEILETNLKYFKNLRATNQSS
ncbi:MAG: hypothetical protein IM537_09730 [Pseudanabaena sp. M57BS1SP1A06MG]|nr:hypothetical protein [Pseudanabaena sp. M53BS1SP1A06MG]MCA6580836.1 hypothetical protein [Pseudanabaena sp. M34BS1SP1A06MG]MCA6592574.1 hypothetical protein [Pseudanabaena sp. M38BS1SP1A06MG]MCA6600468.1 hypothetical protein [Pseudanabaena sp. M57BS1SP1A06MG]